MSARNVHSTRGHTGDSGIGCGRSHDKCVPAFQAPPAPALRIETGQAPDSGTIKCTGKISGGVALRSAGAFASGRAQCSFAIPRTAKAKIVRGRSRSPTRPPLRRCRSLSRRLPPRTRRVHRMEEGPRFAGALLFRREGDPHLLSASLAGKIRRGRPDRREPAFHGGVRGIVRPRRSARRRTGAPARPARARSA